MLLFANNTIISPDGGGATGVFADAGADAQTLGNNIALGFVADINGAGQVTNFVTADGDPEFVDQLGGDYHLAVGSSCISAGTDLGKAEDFEGNPRPMPVGTAGPDIGAYEEQTVMADVTVWNLY
jgi:hypothetical protein